MEYNRTILNSTAGKLSSAVRHIEAIVDWLAGDGEKTFRGVSVPGEVDALRRDKAGLMEALEMSACFLCDEWPYIENNRARLFEMERFLAVYGCFRSKVLEYDDARMDNEEKAWSLLDDYMQPQEYVILVNWADRQFSFQKNHLNEVSRKAVAGSPLHGLARKLSHEFCIGFSDEDLESLIRDHELPMLRGQWFGEKNYATYFGKALGLSCAQMNACFDFKRDNDNSRNIKLNYSKNDDLKVGPDSPIARILAAYPIDEIKTHRI